MTGNRRFGSLAAVALLASGCLGPGTSRSPQLFVLSAAANPAPSETETPELRLGVGPVALPERLNRPQIVTRAGEHEVILSEFSQWAEPLEKNFAEILSENLSRLISTDRVVVYPWPARTKIDLKVEVEVTRFAGQPGGDVALAARWRLTEGNGSEVLPLRLSSYTEPIGASCAEALVASMSRALGALSRDIASAIAGAAR